MQVSRGRFQASLTHVPVGDWSLQYLTFEHGASVCAGDAPRDRYAMLVPLELGPQCRLLGQPLTPHSLAIYSPGSEHADAMGAGSRAVVIVAPDEVLSGSNDSVFASARQGSQLRETSRVGLNRLRDLLCRISQASKEPGRPLECAEARKSLADSLLCAVKAISQTEAADLQTGSKLGRPRLPRREVLRRIRDLLEHEPDKPVYVGELAAAIGISQPSLQRVFHEWFGMPPARYLALKRLHLARQRLRQGTGETVTAIASSLGFWDQSRFSKSYRSVFGELPSETLRRSGRPLSA
jgi:AraC family ethanolamine operon transcriptional activator